MPFGACLEVSFFDVRHLAITAVLEQQLVPVYEGTPFTPADLPEYAGQVFDFAMDRPDLMRLTAWSTLERSPRGDRHTDLTARGARVGGELPQHSPNGFVAVRPPARPVAPA